ncbi:maleylpyruvate isomerase family mycothiol-dependent enzyme [Streptomyces sp. NPDC051776]|uniref:maleylpyruvate isomerase family mycothiol-dependent enzyme n=1 Tax=Streptomyces sp. NPDC051776 TaxID=3155414 RepID=UPI0034361131
MTDHGIDPIKDMAAVREATDRLLVTARGLDDAALREPSRLTGWTRGHVLAHIARNADALLNVLTAARTGTHVPMYASAESRTADIERDAPRPLGTQIQDLAASAERFNNEAAALHSAAWPRTVELRNGVTDVAARVPFRRLIEVELHHVDLGAGCTVADLPASFVDRDLEYVAGERFAGRADVPALVIRVDDGRSWRTGRGAGGSGGTDEADDSGAAPDAGEAGEAGEPTIVSGSPAALLGWLTGRSDGAALDAGGSALPALPPLG